MSETNYPGIDYGLGQTNRDPATGIHYGVINMNALNAWAWESFEADYGEPTCPICGGNAVDYDDEKHGDYSPTQWYGKEPACCCDYACKGCEVYGDGETFLRDEPAGYYLDDGEYAASVDSHNDVFLVKSPYYTRAQYCSPCAPGAGHLENPCPDGPKTYCFGHDWFEGNKAPYPVYRVSDGSEVLPD